MRVMQCDNVGKGWPRNFYTPNQCAWKFLGKLKERGSSEDGREEEMMRGETEKWIKIASDFLRIFPCAIDQSNPCWLQKRARARDDERTN
ncbi:hypothetical protein EVAR_100614_1 [Eumeta japonica]|uniref:Uncharacterized protein n=1 Tax=Eumeta variegata TaxID=151549 RepID=A0A4C1ZE32_EUMVA|nr:hypothetical protein EVAR_100614_1 [Eumeta japonica]